MKKSTRFFTFLLAIFMLVTLIPMGAFSAFAADENESAQGGEEITGEVVQSDGSVKTKYGTIPADKADASELPFAVFQNGEFVDAFATFKEAMPKATNHTEKTDVSKSVVLLRADFALPPNGGYSNTGTGNKTVHASVTIDLGGHVLSHTAGPLIHNSSKTKDDANYQWDFTFKNGTIKKAFEKALFQSDSTSVTPSVATKTLNFVFDNVIFETAEDAKTTGGTVLLTNDNKTTVEFISNVTFNDCTFKLTGAYLFSMGKNSKSYYNATFNGGKIEAASFNPAHLGSTGNGNTLTFGKGSDGNYITLTTPSTAAAPTGTYTSAEGELKFAKTAVSGDNSIYTLINPVTEYGTISDEYLSVVDYPIIVFDGEGSVLKYSHSTNGVSPGTSLIAAYNAHKNGENSYIIIRDSITTSGYDGNFGARSGSITIDLMGHTLDMTAPLLYAEAKNLNDLDVKVMDGSVIAAGASYLVTIMVRTSNDSYKPATREDGKTFNFVFDNVTFGYADGTAVKPIIQNPQSPSSRNQYLNANVTLNNCTVDLTNVDTPTDAVTLFYFNSADVGLNRYYIDTTINGGTIKAESLENIVIGTHDKNGSFKFGKNTAGEYVTLETSGSVPTTVFDTVEGIQMVFAASGTDGKYVLATYCAHANAVDDGDCTTAVVCPDCGRVAIPAASEHDVGGVDLNVTAEAECEACGTIVTKYGVIPADYADKELYPFIMFNSSKGFVAADSQIKPLYQVHKDDTNDSVHIIVVRRSVEGILRDSNMGNKAGTLTIDLMGYTLTCIEALFNAGAKGEITATTTFNVTVINGTLLQKTGSQSLVRFFVPNDTISEKKYSEDLHRIFNFTFENVTFAYAEGAAALPFVNTQNSSNYAHYIEGSVTFNNCTFDLTKNVPEGALTLFQADNSKNPNSWFAIQINGGTIKANDFDNITLATWDLTDDDGNGWFGSFKFGKDANDNYTKIVLPETVTDPRSNPFITLFETATGEKLVFQATANAGEFTLSACDHKYDNACDTECNVCKETRVPPHTPAEDDGDCTTAVTCTECGTVTTPAKDGHTPEADDGDCTTAVKCSVCGTVTTPAKDGHTPEADDGDCTTAVKCVNCEKNAVEATNGHTPEADDGDCTTPIKCKDCDQIAVEAKASHTGGTATCIAKAQCAECGMEYGELDGDNHVGGSDEWYQENGVHYHMCGCGDKINETLCSGGVANCMGGAICSTCFYEYGEPDEDNHVGSTGEWHQENGVHYHMCGCGDKINEALCSGGVANCMGGAICSTCFYEYGEPDEDNHVGSTGEWHQENGAHYKLCVCGDKINEALCSGGTATCMGAAVCSTCDNTYGELDGDNHVGSLDHAWYQEDDAHYQICACGDEINAGDCSGGRADCLYKATCKVCDNEYGEIGPHDFDGDCDKVCNLCEFERDDVAPHTYQNTCDRTCDVCREKRSITHTFKNACDDTCDVCYAKRDAAAHTGGSATCESKAVCSSCGAEYGELGEHVYGSALKRNSTHHWKECACGSKAEEAEHEFGEWTEKDGVRTKSCACGYTVSDTMDVEEGSSVDAMTVAIVSVGVIAGGEIVFSIAWFVFKKKR